MYTSICGGCHRNVVSSKQNNDSKVVKIFSDLGATITKKKSRNGKYISISIVLRVTDSNKVIDYYKQADVKTKYAIRQLNNLCHEIESWVMSYRKSIIEPDWMRPSQITTFLNAPRYDLHEEGFVLFKSNRLKSNPPN